MEPNENDDRLIDVLSRRRQRFAPGFEDRVMERLHGRRHDTADALAWMFPRLAAAALLATTLLGATTIWRSAAPHDGRSTLETALGLPEVSLHAAYTIQP